MFDQDIQTPRNLFKNLSFASVFDKLLGVWISWWNTLPRVWYHVIYCFYHSKIKSISSRHCVISSIIYLLIRFKFLQGKQLSGVMLTTFPLAICSSLVAKQCRCDDTSVVDLMWNRVSYGIAAIGVRAQIYRGGGGRSPLPNPRKPDQSIDLISVQKGLENITCIIWHILNLYTCSCGYMNCRVWGRCCPTLLILCDNWGCRPQCLWLLLATLRVLFMSIWCKQSVWSFGF